ncbi:transcriptional regulator [Candidatus Cerribacteria bacterium 'Amazon FNV 2010 28 9']|uniref:Transcriptional regulator n=1 Tax=Candidatus Cerribacteria bacterium 'Amazon FNV 2010 28 9' TaxID=2081795 RepID=A0A317JNH8_9BACT|nr:MAG: transcriptional regulator [Candidatus Cerribacteria bacterium 'Amazon FNV 2010 28 9']
MTEQFLDQLIEEFLKLKTKHAMKEFLGAILTPGELEEIPKRLQIVKMLKKNIPQRDIAEKLGVGIATVTRGSRELQKGHFKNIT